MRSCVFARRLGPVLLTGAVLLGLAAFTPRRATLTIFAAASLTEAFSELGDTLEARQPGLRIDFNHAGSQALALQLRQGASADLFASADERWMQAVRDSGLIAGNATVFAWNRLVTIVPKTNPARIVAMPDLARGGIKLVLAGDAVPAGRYARTMLAALATRPGYAADYGTRVLRNVVSNEDNVKGVVAKVQLGEADAGIVYASDLSAPVMKQVTVIAIPEEANPLTPDLIATLRRAPNPAAAKAFVDLLLSPTGADVLRRHGFVIPPGTR